MNKINTEIFNKIKIDFYKIDSVIWIKRRDLGEALGYAYPGRSASKLHSRHKSKLNLHSRKEIMVDSAGVGQETVMYNLDAVKVFCDISEKPLAEEFLIWVQKVICRFKNEVEA